MTWEELSGSLKALGRRAADKVSDTVDLASLQVKLSLAQKELNDTYEHLGRVAYRHFSEEADLSEKVAVWVRAVDGKRATVKRLEAKIARYKKPSEEASSEDPAKDTKEE